MKKIVFTFGRFNPPTTGHLLLATKVKEEARRRGADYKIYGSNTKDSKRNPLSSVDKSRYMKKVLNDTNIVVNKNSGNPYTVLQQLSKDGYTDVTMVVGADRVAEFKNGMKKYIGKKGYENIANFDVVSAGERDPDAEGIEGMSASKMRAAAAEGNINAFRLGIPSHVSSTDAMKLFKAVRKGMGVRGNIKESWFDYDEFVEFAENYNQLDEISVQARRKMARTAKRTAKIRARKRKIKEKRRKGKKELVKKANKAAVAKVRAKLIRGMKWKDVPFLQREKIDAKIKKKKKRIAAIAKKMMPAMQKAEKERLAQVRARMTTKDPVKAVESVDLDFENTFLMEDKELRARIKANDEANRRKKEPMFYLVKTKNGKHAVVDRVAKNHTVEKEGTAKQIKGVAQKYANEPEGFEWTDSATAIGLKQKEQKAVERGTSKEGGTTRTPQEPVELTPTQKRTQANTDKAGEIRSKLDAATAQDEWDQYQQGKEINLNQVEMENYATDMGQKLGIPQKEPTAEQAKKLKSTKDGLFEDWHAAVDVEAAVVAVGNGCHLKENGEEMRTCLSASGISDGDIKKLAESPTLIPAAMRMLDRVGMQLPEGMQWQHTGKGLGEVALSQTYDIAGAKNTTPKTDLRACNPKTGKCMNLSMKMGPGQLMSGQAGESIGTYRVVLDRMRGCKGKSIDSNGNESGVGCNRKLGAGDKALIKRMEGVIKNVEETFINSKVSEGMGPVGWWLGKGIGGRKPSWWDRTGPGRPGMDISWEDAKGKDPNDHPEWFMEDKAELEKNMAIIQDANKKMKVIKKELGEIFSSGKFGQEMKEHVMYEAMTGCGKFCEGCCGTDICKECQSIHAATHVIVGNKDGTGGMIKEIEPPGSKMLKEMSENTKVDVRFKTTSGVKSAQGWFKEMEEGIFEKIKFLTKKEIDAGVKQKKLTAPEHKRLLELIAYTGQKLPDGTTKWEDLTDAQKKKILRKAEIKMGTYSVNSVSGMNTTFETGGVGKIFDEVQPRFRTFLEQTGDKENSEYGLKDAMKWVGHDPGRLAEFLGLEPTIDAPHESYGDVFEQEPSGQSNTITIDGITKTIPIAKDDEYRDYQAEREEGGRDEPQSQQEDKINEDFRLLLLNENEDAPPRLPGVNIRMRHTWDDKNMQVAKQQRDIAQGRRGTSTDAATSAASATDDAKSKITAQITALTQKQKELRQVISQMRTARTKVQPESYEFKESSVHGLGSFATRDIKAGEELSLYYLNLLEDIPSYQRTDFCRWTNHSHINENVSLIENDGNFTAHAFKEIKEGEELFIDYFYVLETIINRIGNGGQVIDEVIRWTDGYEHIEIEEDNSDWPTLLDYFIEQGDSPDFIHESEFYQNFLLINENEGDDNRAAYLKQYGARPEQRKRRSARTNARNKLIRSGRASVGDGKDLDHKDGNPLNNSANNLRMVNRSFNRGRDNNKWRKNEEHGAGDEGTDKLLKKYVKDTPYMTINDKFSKEL